MVEKSSSLRSFILNSKFSRIVISTILLIYVIWNVPIKEIINSLGNFNINWLIPAFILYKASVFVKVMKMYRLSQAVGIKISFREVLAIFYLGNLVYTVFPSLDVAYVGFFGCKSRGYARATALILFDRLSGMVALFSLGAIAFLRYPELLSLLNPVTPTLILFILGIGISGIIILFFHKIQIILWNIVPNRLKQNDGIVGNTINSFYSAIVDLAQKKKVIPAALGYSLIVQFTIQSLYFVLCKGLKIDIPFFHLMAVFPLMVVAGMLPSILGIGVRDIGYIIMFQQLNIDPSKAIALSFIQLSLLLLAAFIGSLILFFPKRKLNPN